MTADAERLAAIRARLEGTTRGPWVAEFPEHREDALIYAYNGDLHIADVGGLSTDAEFIAHAPEDIAYLLSVAAELDAEKERADEAESALLEVEDRLRAPGYGTSDSNRIALLHIESWRSGTARVRLSPEAERDALRARIEAAKAVFADADVLDETALSMSAALAGDQPKVTPEPVRQLCECVVCGEKTTMSNATPAWEALHKHATPEPPHLDPFPWVMPDGERSRYGLTFGIVCRFDPLPADENGKAYSRNREDYP